MEGLQNDFSAGIFAGGPANLGSLKSVVHGVTDHVHQRVVDVFEDGRIHFNVLTDDEHAGQFSVLSSHVAHAASKPVEGRTDRNHSNLHYQFLQLKKERFQALVGFQYFVAGARSGAFFLGHAPHASLSDGEFHGQVQHAVQFSEVHAEICGRFGGGCTRSG